MKLVVPFLYLLILQAIVPAHAEDQWTMRDVSFVANCDGSTQKYVLMLPDGFDQRQRQNVLIALHGHGADRWQFAKDARDECRASRDVASRHRMIFVSPDYRAKTSWMGPKAEADVVQIIEDLRRRYPIGKVFICGGSMGGAACLTFAARRPELVDGVASMNGTANHLEYESFQEAIRESFGGTKDQIPLEYKKRSAEYWPERFTIPVGLTAGGMDKAVPPGSVLRLANVLKHLKRDVLLVYRENGGHSTNYDDATQILEYVIQARLAPTTHPVGASSVPSNR